MEYKDRAAKDIEKLSLALDYFKREFKDKYKYHLNIAEKYFFDAKYFFDKGDYFTSFGCANYSYGILESIFILEKNKYFHELEREE